MKSLKSSIFSAGVFVLALGGGGAASAATTHTLNVEAGKTNTVSELLGETVPGEGDWIKKTGAGTLVAVSNYKDILLNLQIAEGVYYVPDSAGVVHGKEGGQLVIDDGATVNLQGGTTEAFKGWWRVSFAGQGTGEGDNLGAIAIGGSAWSPTLGCLSRYTMTDDATIYSYGQMNAVFSGSRADLGPALDMNGHTLTVRGKSASSVFRPRWKWRIEDSGSFVIRSGTFARQKTTNEFSANIPSVTFTDGARMDVYSSPSIWDLVDEFVFDAGTSITKVNGDSSASMTLRKVVGPPTVSADVATLTVSDTLVARGADLVNGDCLTTANDLVFSDGCTLDVTGLDALGISADTAYVVARSSTSITGTPVLSPASSAAQYYTLSNSGTELVLSVKDTVVDVATRAPLTAGEGSAEANAAAWKALCESVGSRDDLLFIFSAGDWHFGETLDATACTGARPTFMGKGTASVIHSSLRLGAATGAVVRDLKFSGIAGPAVVAEQTQGLSISGCALDGVTGAWTDGANYPFVATGVGDFEATGNTFRGAAYDALGLFDGGSQTTKSDVQAGKFVINVPSDGWWDWNAVTNATCLTTNKTSGLEIVKKGAGTFDPKTSLASFGLTGVDVREGQYVTRGDSHLGVAKASVRVQSGASLTFADNVCAAQDREITIAGTGVSADTPAVRFTTACTWNKAESVKWILSDDATMYISVAGEMGVFLWGNVNANGHTLTLKGVSGANYRFGRTCAWSGGGTVVADGVALSASPRDNAYPAVVDEKAYAPTDGIYPLFKFINGARLLPDSHEICLLVANVDFAAGTQIDTKDSKKAYVTFKDFTGAPTVSANITNFVVRGSCRARAADVFAETPACLTSGGAVTFLPGATFELDDPGAKPVAGLHALVEAAGGVSGKPRATGETAKAGWHVSRANATRLQLGLPPGACFVIQ